MRWGNQKSKPGNTPILKKTLVTEIEMTSKPDNVPDQAYNYSLIEHDQGMHTGNIMSQYLGPIVSVQTIPSDICPSQLCSKISHHHSCEKNS